MRGVKKEGGGTCLWRLGPAMSACSASAAHDMMSEKGCADGTIMFTMNVNGALLFLHAS